MASRTQREPFFYVDRIHKGRKRPAALTEAQWSCSFEVKTCSRQTRTWRVLSPQQLPPHVRIWDSVTLNTLHVIGTGFFDRAVTCIAFSKSVSLSREGGALRSRGAGGRQCTGHCPAVCTGPALKPSGFPCPSVRGHRSDQTSPVAHVCRWQVACSPLSSGAVRQFACPGLEFPLPLPRGPSRSLLSSQGVAACLLKEPDGPVVPHASSRYAICVLFPDPPCQPRLQVAPKRMSEAPSALTCRRHTPCPSALAPPTTLQSPR